ncbi:MAG: ECF transporter S component [Oscillospiraceae bacterium]|nr:ECF transporter S component [Oscillospiraceae bacterium]
MLEQKTRTLTTLAMLAALSVLLVAAIHFPILPAATFLEYDPADIPIFIATFLFGPWAGLSLTAVVSVLQGITVSAASGWIGIVMHFLATGSFVLVTGFLYRKKKTRGRAAVGLSLGVVTMSLVMCGCNLVFTPLFMGQPVEAVLAMLVPVILPFNLIKAGVNGLITWVVYKPISKALHKSLDKKPAA